MRPSFGGEAAKNVGPVQVRPFEKSVSVDSTDAPEQFAIAREKLYVLVVSSDRRGPISVGLTHGTAMHPQATMLRDAFIQASKIALGVFADNL
jgi:hypothetical protein